MWVELETYLERIRQLACYKKMSERQKASFLQFSAIFIIHEATREVSFKKNPKPSAMEIKHKAKWYGYAYGFKSPLDFKPDWDYVTGHCLCKLNGCHSVSTGTYKNREEIRFYAYDVVAGFTFSQFWPLDHLQFLKVCYALYAGEEADIPLIDPRFFDKEVIERYEKYNLLGKSSDPDKPGEVLNIPVLSAENAEFLFETIFHEAIIDFSQKFNSELEELFVNPVEPPKHLKDVVPEFLKYQLCADAFVMALVYQGAWNRWYKNELASNNEPVPAMIIYLGKELNS